MTKKGINCAPSNAVHSLAPPSLNPLLRKVCRAFSLSLLFVHPNCIDVATLSLKSNLTLISVHVAYSWYPMSSLPLSLLLPLSHPCSFPSSVRHFCDTTSPNQASNIRIFKVLDQSEPRNSKITICPRSISRKPGRKRSSSLPLIQTFFISRCFSSSLCLGGGRHLPSSLCQ